MCYPSATYNRFHEGNLGGRALTSFSLSMVMLAYGRDVQTKGCVQADDHVLQIETCDCDVRLLTQCAMAGDPKGADR